MESKIQLPIRHLGRFGLLFLAFSVILYITSTDFFSRSTLAAPSPTPTQTATPTPSPAAIPVSNASISDQSEEGTNGWYISAVTTTLSATMVPSSTTGAQIKNISYRLNASPTATVSGSLTIQTFPQNGNHTLTYFATDTTDKIENPAKTLSFKVDTVAPNNWRNFNALRLWNSHTFIFSISVDDQTSGLDSFNTQMQYSVDDGNTWGYYDSLISCNSNNWVQDGWLPVLDLPFFPGAKTGSVVTLPIDVCNSNWQVCKIIKFRVPDLAGNVSEQKICLYGGWMRTSSGDIYSGGDIDMQAGASQNKASALVQTSGNNINNFESSNSWNMKQYMPTSDLSSIDFANFYPKISSQAQALPNGSMPTTSGYYYVNGDLTISNNMLTNGYGNVQNFAAIVFVSGDVTINTDINTHPTSVYVISALGNINVHSNVDELEGIYVSDGIFDSSYNNNGNSTLTLNGSVWALNGFNFSRSLPNTQNNNNPAEIFNFQPQYIFNKELNRLVVGSYNTSWKEFITY